MNSKKSVSIIVLLLLVGVIIYVTLQGNEGSSETGNIPPVQELEEVRVSIDPRAGKERFALGQVVNGFSIRQLESDSRNLLLGAFSGDQKLGELNALEVYKPIFTADVSKAVFETATVCGAECIDFEMYIANLEEKSLTRITPPRDDNDFPGERRPMEDIEYVISPVKWIDDSTLKITGYFVARGPEGNFRVSAEEIFVYNVTNKSYSQE